MVGSYSITGLGTYADLDPTGIIGFIRFTAGWYAVLVKRREKVAMIGGHYVYQCGEVATISISANAKPDKPYDEARSVLTFAASSFNELIVGIQTIQRLSTSRSIEELLLQVRFQFSVLLPQRLKKARIVRPTISQILSRSICLGSQEHLRERRSNNRISKPITHSTKAPYLPIMRKGGKRPGVLTIDLSGITFF